MPEFVTFTDYYTGAPVAVRTAYIVTVAVRASATQIELDGDHAAVMVSESVAVVVARLNGEDLTDGR